jgi:nucleoside 2-deoxyribosyltransferase
VNATPVWLQDGTERYGQLERTDFIVREINELLTQWPRTVADRTNRTLCNLARLSPVAGHVLDVHMIEPALMFAHSQGEAKYHIKALLDSGLLTIGTKVGGIVATAALTPAGWDRFEELTRGTSSPENPVFAAMWFGETAEEKSQMNDVFSKAIQPSAEQSGYRATRVDLAEHNDWIMDKVLGDIRLAPFVVADFTGNRNGVYLEAGFARGLGIPVIHTCKHDHFDKAHFDTKQLNHVLWDTVEELRAKLYHRILGTIGRGPHVLSDPK